MSVEIMQEVWDHAPVDQGALLVLLALADCANKDSRTCYPGIDTLSRKTRLERRQVRRCIKKLEQIGIILVRERASPVKTNLYKITPQPWLFETMPEVAGDKMSPPRWDIQTPTDGTSRPPKPSVTEEKEKGAAFKAEPSRAAPSQQNPEVSRKRNGWLH